MSVTTTSVCTHSFRKIDHFQNVERCKCGAWCFTNGTTGRLGFGETLSEAVGHSVYPNVSRDQRPPFELAEINVPPFERVQVPIKPGAIGLLMRRSALGGFALEVDEGTL